MHLSDSMLSDHWTTMVTEDPPVRGPRPHQKSSLGCRRCKDRKIKVNIPVELHEYILINNSAVRRETSRVQELFAKIRHFEIVLLGWPDKCPAQIKPASNSSRDNSNFTRKAFRYITSKDACCWTADLHHYITHFAPQQPHWGRFGFESIDQFFVVDALQLGFGHEAVLSGLLGLSACHYPSLEPRDQHVNRAAREYLRHTTCYQTR